MTRAAGDIPGSTDTKLPKRTLFYYGLSDMPIQVATIAVSAYIPNYFGADLGVSLAAVGTVWLIARLFDAFTDPLIGYLSDRTNTRWGRRRVWMVAAVPFMMVAIYKLFFPVPPVDANYLLIWMCVLWLGWTMLLIPYYAWAAELSPDYNERSVITGWRTWLGMFANVLSKLVPVAALVLFAYGGTREVLVLIGSMMLVLLPVTVGVTVWKVPETRNFTPSRMPIVKGLRLMWANGPFKILVTAFFINYTGTALSTAAVLFFIRGVLGEEEAGIVMLLTYYGTNLCSIPFWVWISAKIGKHRAWIAGLLMFWVSPLYMLLGPGDFYWMLPITAITGFAGGSGWVLPNSMKADVIDLDTLKSGENRAAWFFAVWSLAIKIALSVGPWLALTALALVGFDPTPGAVNTPEQLWGLRILFCFSTPLFFTLAAVVATRYPITEERHRRLRSALERRQARRLAARA